MGSVLLNCTLRPILRSTTLSKPATWPSTS